MAVSGLITAMQGIFATPEYADRIPNSVKSVITAGNYGTTTFPTEIENAVYNVLVDKIGKQEIYKFEYNNFDASQYDKGYLPFGGIIEDDYVEAMKADEVNNLPTLIISLIMSLLITTLIELIMLLLLRRIIYSKLFCNIM